MSDSVKVSTTYDHLFAGDYPVVRFNLDIAASQTLSRGTILGTDGSGNGVPLDHDSATSSINTPYGVLLDDIDTTGGVANAAVALTGEFNEDFITLESGTTVADVWVACRDKNIFLQPVKAV